MRFPEFSGEWEMSSIGEQFELYSGNTPSRMNKNQFDGSINWITSGELKEHYISDTKEKISEEAAKNNSLKLLPVGTFVIAIYGLEANGVRGTCSITTRESTISQACMAFTSKMDIQNEFLYSWYKKHGNIIGIKYAQGTKQQNLSYDIIERFNISYPCMEEQEKLIRFISLIDQRIATQNKIIEDLKKLKSAIIDLLFCSPKEEYPRKRVTGFSDAWGLVKLSDICDRITTKNSESTCSLVLTVAAQYGLVSQLDFFNKSVASENLESYYLLEKGDFAYNKSYSSDYSWGAVKRLDLYPQGVLSPLYICFRPNPSRIDSDYLALYFESRKWHKGIADIAGEGARNHGLLNISVGDFFETKHRIPSLAEQRKIATILNGLTAKISHNQALLTAFVQQRKYMLAKMFI